MDARSFIVVASLIALGGPAAAQTRPVTLEWDPARDGSAAGYIVYVGEASGSYFEQYDVGNQTRFAFTKAVSGRSYYFAVAAYSAGHQVGPRSEELFFLSGAVTSGTPTQGTDGTAAASRVEKFSPSPGNDVFCASPSACYDVETIASLQLPVESLTAARDGRLFFIEDRARVRGIVGKALLAEPMLNAAAAQQFTGLMLDPDFARTGWVYVGVIQTRRDGVRELDLVRYREVANVLGEGAVLVAGLPLPQSGDASLAIDSSRRFYIAMPGAAGEPGATPYAGMILRFEQDGTAVRGDGPRAPIFAAGYKKPASLAWTPALNTLWLAGTGGASDGTFARYSTQDDVSPTQYRTATALAGLSAYGTDTFTPANDAAAVLLDDAGGLLQVLTGPGGVSVRPWIEPGALGGVVSAVSTASSDGIYLVVETARDSTAHTTSIVRLRQK